MIHRLSFRCAAFVALVLASGCARVVVDEQPSGGATGSGGEDPCGAVVCDSPPPTTCSSATTIRSYYAPEGACAAGECSYEYVDSTCVSGCSGGACNVALLPGSLSAGVGHTCAVTPAGAVKCWGYNISGQLGGKPTDYFANPVPVAVTGLSSSVVAVYAGFSDTCALTSLGGVECWGSNGTGQLGNGSTSPMIGPVGVTGLSSGVVAVSVGGLHACALTSAGAVECWGGNQEGQLGDKSTYDKHLPVGVTGLSSGIIAISAGLQHTCALTSSGAVECWGYNEFGELGNGATTSSPVPVGVVGLSSGVIAISASGSGSGPGAHTCALTSSGAVKCWGYNASGQLGDGTTKDSAVPVDVKGLSSGVVAIATGHFHTCAITHTGGVECWGSNMNGQLGDGTTEDSAVPVEVTGLLPSEHVAIAGGGYHTCALTSTGAIRCWGHNVYGELGNDSTADSPVPVAVVGF